MFHCIHYDSSFISNWPDDGVEMTTMKRLTFYFFSIFPKLIAGADPAIKERVEKKFLPKRKPSIVHANFYFAKFKLRKYIL